MLNEKILSFLEECKAKPELWEKLMKVAPEDKDGLIKIAGEAGYHFTAEEWTGYQNMRFKKNELAEDELDKVSGGGFFGLTKCPREYNNFLCGLCFCPHFHKNQQNGKAVLSCDDGYFTNLEDGGYSERSFPDHI